MKNFYSLATVLCFMSLSAFSQDEGEIVKKERIDRSHSISLSIGPSFTLGKNIGDYKVGATVEASYEKRLNRVLSIGGSISYTEFAYDPAITTAKSGSYVGYGDPNDWGTKYDLSDFSYTYGYVLNLKGGDLSLTSVGFNVKLNFIPIRDNTKFSVYGFVKPFFAVASRKAVSGSAPRYTYETYEDDQGTTGTNDDILHYNLGDGQYYADGYVDKWGPADFDALKAKTVFTGGVYLGPGVELFPAKNISFFAQAGFGYTFPVNYVSTQSYSPSVASYVDPKFPIVKKGFPLLNVQIGAAYNF